MGWPKLADTVNSAKVVRADLDDLIVAVLIVVHVVVCVVISSLAAANVVHVQLFVDLGDHQIEDGDNVGRVVLNLAVERLIELEDVIAIDVKNVAIEFAHLAQLLDVVGRALVLLVVIVIVVVLDLLKVVDEVFDFHLDLVCVDVCAPQHLCMGTHLICTCKLVLVEHTSRGGLIVGQLKASPFRIECRLVKQSIHIEEAALFVEVRHQCGCVQDADKKGAK